jgi:hypothetical protein
MDWFEPLELLATAPYQSARFDIPHVFLPDRQGWAYVSRRFTDFPIDPHGRADVRRDRRGP